MRRALITSTLVLALGLGASDARADGVVLAPSNLPTEARKSLEKAVAKARQEHPTAFARVASLRLAMKELDRNKRGRLASVSPSLKGLGPDALMPMIEELAFDATPRGTLPAKAWLAWRVALLEAVGALRDARSMPVTAAVAAEAEVEPLVVRAAAQALAKLNSDAAAARLTTILDKAQGERRSAVLAGMGHCRRTPVVEKLAEEMAAASGEDVLVIARSLGDAGNAWAWRTPFVRKSGEAATVRRVALDALMEAFVAHHDVPQARTMLTQAILVVDHAETPQAIAKARTSADAGLDAALDALARRFDESPLRR